MDGYQIHTEIGRGGMSVVYRAQQLRPIQRLVALKIATAESADARALERFDFERRTLATLNHRCITKVFDAGTTSACRPFLAMELVEGLPLTEFCDRHRLTLPERLQLLHELCDAIHFAHRRGIVHRDLKPGNVLITREGNQVMPKVLDFGLASASHAVPATRARGDDTATIGTLEYMSPEQAAGDGEVVDERSDIYSLGVMLYEQLCGCLPFTHRQLRDSGPFEALRVIREVAPERPSQRLRQQNGSDAHTLRRTTPRSLQKSVEELEWIAARAMAKEPLERYSTAAELGADLQRFRDHLPIDAAPRSISYSLRKLLQRRRLQFTTLTVLILATAVAMTVALTGTSGAEACTRDIELLARLSRLTTGLAAVNDLDPPWPSRIPAMEAWLRDTGEPLLAMRSQIETTLEDLHQRALPWTEPEQQSDRQRHPDFVRWQRLAAERNALARARSVLAGTTQLDVPALPAQAKTLDPDALNMLAWQRVAPLAERQILGEEPIGLAYALAAVNASAPGTTASEHLDTLAWAYLANGDNSTALRHAEAAVASCQPEDHALFVVKQRQIQDCMNRAEEQWQQVTNQCDGLERRIATRRTYTFPPDQGTSAVLLELIGDLQPQIDKVERVNRSLQWAQWLRDGLCADHPRAKSNWNEVRRTIEVDPTFRSEPPDLGDEATTGLVPLGRNPITGLWEFYDLRSAWEGTGNPSELSLPIIDPAGRVAMTGETGIVFVLLPGCDFVAGAQNTKPDDNHFDADAQDDEGPPHVVHIGPFLISRFELTRGQWRRLFGTDPSYYEGDDRYPVENITWLECAAQLRRAGMRLPSEAEWEYAARGTSLGRWACGDDMADLSHNANLADQSALGQGPVESWSDGHILPAPVGTFDFQAFGLHDVHGNVGEWCNDRFDGPYGQRAGDGTDHVVRGGSHTDLAVEARLTYRNRAAADSRGPALGLRPARSLARIPR